MWASLRSKVRVKDTLIVVFALCEPLKDIRVAMETMSGLQIALQVQVPALLIFHEWPHVDILHDSTWGFLMEDAHRIKTKILLGCDYLIRPFAPR